jgi:O-antigen ligase
MQKFWLNFKNLKLNGILNSLILAYLFLLPWSAVYIFDEKLIGGAKWQFGTGIVYATELLLWLIFLLFFISSHRQKFPPFSEIKAKLARPSWPTLLVLTLWGFVFWSGLSILWAPEKSASFYLWFRFLETGVFFFILLLSKFNVQKISWAIILSASLQALLAISQFLNQQTWGNKFLGLVAHSPNELGALVIETADGRWLRAYGSFNDPNLLGGFLSIALVAGVWLMAQTKFQKTLLALIIPIAFGWFFTFSRASALALAVGLVIILIASRKQALIATLKTTFTIAITTIVLTIIFSPLIFSRANLSGRLEAESVGQRAEQIQTAWRLFQAHPLLGVGLNNYTYVLWQAQPGQPAYDYREAENIYFLILAETGLIGLLFFISLIIATAIIGFRNRNYFGLSLLLMIFILGNFYHYPYSQYQGLILFFTILALGLKNYPKQS